MPRGASHAPQLIIFSSHGDWRSQPVPVLIFLAGVQLFGGARTVAQSSYAGFRGRTMLAATLQIPATLAVGAEQAMIEYVESQITACEFDILVLPQCVLQKSSSSMATMRYWVELSARKHALVVAGAIEANDRGQFLTTLIAFQGMLWGRYVKRYPEPEESHRFKGGRSHCVVAVPGVLAAVLSASELANIKCTSVFDFPGMAVGLVSGALARDSHAPHPSTVAQQYGIYLICSNLVGSVNPRRRTAAFSGYCGVYGPDGSTLAEPKDKNGFCVAEIPDIPRVRRGQGDLWSVVKYQFYTNENFDCVNTTMSKDGFPFDIPIYQESGP